MFLTGTVNTPPPTTLPNDDSGETFPYMLVADEAFPLKTYMMLPYAGRLLDDDSKRIFNYRLSRARRVIENVFGRYKYLIGFVLFDV